MVDYLARITDRELAARMRVMGAVLIEGPKACGKTATASQVANTMIRFDEDEASRALVALDPSAFFDGEPPILFDEWQLEPAIWNRVRRQVDDRGEPGQFILTGSATPRDDASRHSGAGRFAVIRMRPMSLFESGHSNGKVSIAALMQGEGQTGKGTDLTYDDLLRRIVIGGWPQLIGKEEDFARDWISDYLKQVTEVDAIVSLRGGKWGAFEIKLNPRDVDKAAAALLRFAANVDTRKARGSRGARCHHQ